MNVENVVSVGVSVLSRVQHNPETLWLGGVVIATTIGYGFYRRKFNPADIGDESGGRSVTRSIKWWIELSTEMLEVAILSTIFVIISAYVASTVDAATYDPDMALLGGGLTYAVYIVLLGWMYPHPERSVVRVGGKVLSVVGPGLTPWFFTTSEDETEDDQQSKPEIDISNLKQEIKGEESDEKHQEEYNEQIETAEKYLTAAQVSKEEHEYRDAVKACEKAKTAAERAKNIAPSQQAKSESRAQLQEISQRRDQIKEQQETYDTLNRVLDSLENKLDTAAETLAAGDAVTAKKQVDVVRKNLQESKSIADDHGYETILTRIADQQTRSQKLNRQIEKERNTVSEVPETIPSQQQLSVAYADIVKDGLIGSGGNADVYYATTDDQESVELAIKEPRLDNTIDTATVDRMIDEANTWQQLDDHNHIVSVIDYGSDPLPWIAMEYMDGGDLSERGPHMEFEQALWTALMTTTAVQHAHRNGVAHLDLKPANILFRSVDDGWDVPKVADWGLSKQLLTHSDSVDGVSPHYAAPEQFDTEQYGRTDTSSDIYQLGTIFYELFTGQPPFEGTTFEVINKIQTETPTPPSEVSDIPEELDEILLTALATEKADRYEHILYLRDDLQDLYGEF